MSLKKNVVYNTLLSLSQVLIPLFTFPYTSRVLGPTGTGIVNFADNLTSYFVIFAALGIPYYGIREVAKIKNRQESLDKLFSELISLHFITTCLLVVLYLILIYFTRRLSHNIHFFLIGCIILLLNIFPIEWFYQGLEEFKFITIRTVCIRFLVVILLFFVVKNSSDSIFLYALNLLAVFLNAIINFTYSRKFVKLKFSNLDLKRHLKPLFGLLASNLAVNVYLLSDSLLLGFLSNDKAVGFYTSSSRINKMIFSCIASFSFVLIPQISSAFSTNKKDRINALITKATHYIILVGIPISFGIFLLAPQLIKLLAGDNYLPAITTIRILCPLTLLMGLSSLFGVQVLIPIGKEKSLTLFVIIGLVVSVFGNLLLIPIFQYNGTAITTILTELVILFLSYYSARKYIDISINLKPILTSLISSLFFIPLYYISILLSDKLFFIVILNLFFSSFLYFLLQYFIFKDTLTIYFFSSFMNFIKRFK